MQPNFFRSSEMNTWGQWGAAAPGNPGYPAANTFPTPPVPPVPPAAAAPTNPMSGFPMGQAAMGYPYYGAAGAMPGVSFIFVIIYIRQAKGFFNFSKLSLSCPKVSKNYLITPKLNGSNCSTTDL